MRAFVSSAIVAGAIAVAAVAAFAQWPSYPTGVPKGPDGKPNMTAPTPRTPDGHPDFTGMWELGRAGGGRGGAGGAARGGAGGGGGRGAGKGGPKALPPTGAPPPDSPTPPPNPNAPEPGSPEAIANPPVGQFFNIGAGFKDGLLPFQPWASALRAQRKGDNNKDNPDAHCLPIGLTQLHMHPQPRKIIQTPQLIVILYEAQGGIRQIFMDGRSSPPKDVEPWYYGYSIGHWDGDDLVVETTGFRDDVWLDVEGSPLTNSGKMIERFRRPNFGTMQIDVTVDDPKAYTKPWTIRVNHRYMADTDLIEFVCEDRDAVHYVGKDAKK